MTYTPTDDWKLAFSVVVLVDQAFDGSEALDVQLLAKTSNYLETSKNTYFIDSWQDGESPGSYACDVRAPAVEHFKRGQGGDPCRQGSWRNRDCVQSHSG